MLDQKGIKNILKKEDPLILEIGSHIGLDTLKFLNEFKDITIYCFEPDPRCIAVFKEIVKDPRCTLIEAAVSNADGTALLHLSGGWPPGYRDQMDWIYGRGDWNASSSIKTAVSNSSMYPWLSFEKTIEVRTLKLDTWIKKNNIGTVDFVWADVQGAERELIEGAVNTLVVVNYFFTEYGEQSPYPDALTRTETTDLLSLHNFEIMPRYSDNGPIGNLLFRNRKLTSQL
ncbi:MAG: FkbM family methyltransferase [Nitrospirota bacterium]